MLSTTCVQDPAARLVVQVSAATEALGNERLNTGVLLVKSRFILGTESPSYRETGVAFRLVGFTQNASVSGACACGTYA
jgi:hypothetical protein